MRKRISIVTLAVIAAALLLFSLAACTPQDNGGEHEHSFSAATCTEPKTCTVCGETEGEALGHSFEVAACTKPKTCTACGETEGTANGHSYGGDNICDVCGHEESTDTPTPGGPQTPVRVESFEYDKNGNLILSMTDGSTVNAGTPTCEHTWSEWTTSTSSCVEAGARMHTCTKCGAVEGEATDANEHTWGEAMLANRNSCDESAVMLYSCTVCKTVKIELIDAPELAHKLGEWQTVTAPTCTECGTERRECERCAYFETRESAPRHTEGEWVIENLPTCTENGVRYKDCINCGESDGHLRTEITAAKGHDFKAMSTVDADCTQDGYVEYACQNEDCGETKRQTLHAHGHSFGGDNVCDDCGYTANHLHSYTSSVTAPTCTSMGYTTYSCQCGYSYRSDYVEPSHHAWGEGVTRVEKTCTQDGLLVYTCVDCGTEMSFIISASHEWVETVVREASCSVEGKHVMTCSVCGHSTEEAITASHKWGAARVITAPTCTEEGVSSHSCTVCGKTEEFSVKETGHHFVDGSCTVCGATITDIVTPSAGNLNYGMYFKVDDIISNYGPEYINEYGVLLDFNEGATLKRFAVYLTQDGTMWRRCIAVVGEGITYATYVPYLSYGEDIKYTGLNSSGINTFSLKENSEGIWCYNDYATIGVNLEDMYGNLLLSLYVIAESGAETRIFDDLEEMKAWLRYEDCEHEAKLETVSSDTKRSDADCTHKATYWYTCEDCGKKLDSYFEYGTAGHSFEAATCTEPKTCTACGETEGEANGHNYSGAFCTVCGEKQPPAYTRVDKNGNKDENGDYILFGTYPQSEVTDSSLKASLNSLAGTPSTNSAAWTSYGYYIGTGSDGSQSNSTDYMWYIDVEHGGEEYRGVYFTSYRPSYTTDSSSTSDTYQDENGYTTSTVYWFKYEPIKWRILTEENGKALLLCEMLIDSQAYQNCYTYSNSYYYATDNNGNILTDENGNKIYANNYAYSTIREWLNDNFYNTAFNDLQKQIIQLTTVDNSAATTSSSSNQYACKNTEDNVFLLSYQDILNTDYGFSASSSDYDEARQKKTTDYAQCQGAYTSTSSGYEGNGYWWLRSPNYYSSYSARDVHYNGYADRYLNVDYTIYGVCPALWIEL